LAIPSIPYGTFSKNCVLLGCEGLLVKITVLLQKCNRYLRVFCNTANKTTVRCAPAQVFVVLEGPQGLSKGRRKLTHRFPFPLKVTHRPSGDDRWVSSWWHVERVWKSSETSGVIHSRPLAGPPIFRQKCVNHFGLAIGFGFDWSAACPVIVVPSCLELVTLRKEWVGHPSAARSGRFRFLIKCCSIHVVRELTHRLSCESR
jgi:hypothetical protein